VFPQGNARLADPVADRLRQRGVGYSALRLEHGRLDEVFRRITAEPAS
jgi:ABC-2 type transport system ATP-binding protein